MVSWVDILFFNIVNIYLVYNLSINSIVAYCKEKNINMLISIIVPVYNTEQYLSVCLKSIINQTYKDIEIILIDDGSTDRSAEICAKYAALDTRIVFIQNSHQGLVNTRKLGVEKAKGLYCIFVDSDDWIKDNLLETVVPLTEMGKIDIVNYSMQSVDGEKYIDWKYTVSEGVYEGKKLEQLYKKMMYDFENGKPGIIQSLCTKIIKRELLQIGLKNVDNRITVGEDAAVVYNVLLISRRVVIIYDYLYLYRINSSSMINTVDIDFFHKINYFNQYMKKKFDNYDKEYRLQEQLQVYLMHFIEPGLKKIFLLNIKPLYRMSPDLNLLKGRIVLYGAGNVGRSYYRQLSQKPDIEILGWIDRKLGGQCIYEQKIEFPEILTQIEFDVILIAVNDYKVAEKIKYSLEQYTQNDRIIWKKPYTMWYEKEIDYG